MNPKMNQADMDFSYMQMGRLSCRSTKMEKKHHSTTATQMIFKTNA